MPPYINDEKNASDRARFFFCFLRFFVDFSPECDRINIGCNFSSGTVPAPGRRSPKGMNSVKSPSALKAVNHLIEGSAVILIGGIILWKQTDFLLLTVFVISLLVAIGGVAKLIGWIFQKPKKSQALFLSLLYMGLGVIMMFLPEISLYVLPVLFSAYLMMNGAVKLVDTLLIIRNKSGELFYSLIPSIFYLTFALILLFSPHYHIRTVLILIGIYCVLLGLTYIMDFVRSVIPTRAQQKIRRKVRITLPIFLAAFIPHTVLTKLNEFLSKESRNAEEFEDIAGKKEERKPDLEIFIHVASDGFCAIGHCDICFDGEVIAYGNYDEAASTPMGIGPGVLLISNKYDYIPFCLNFNKTTIFSFGLILDEPQKESIRKRIQTIKSVLVPWIPDSNPANANIFAAQFCREYGAKCYKFSKGKFKTYFVMSTNCVLLADSIVCAAGTDILNINGIISPGTFYDYLEAEFLKKDSMVISRSVYRMPITSEDIRRMDEAPSVSEKFSIPQE